MSTVDSDGIDEVLQGVTQVALTAAARMGEQLARARQQAARDAQVGSEHAAAEYAARVRAERAAAHAALAPVHRADWWDAATSQDVTRAMETAAAWRQTDPEAERAHARIVEEARARFGVELDAERGRDGQQDRGAGEQGAGQQQRAEEGTETAAAQLVLTADEEAARARSVAIFRDDFGMGQEEAEELADKQVRNRRAAAAERNANADRAEAVGLMVRADVLDRVGEAGGAGTDGHVAGVDELHPGSEAAWDSAERRAALAASLDQVENRAAVEARLTADLSQGRPATEVVKRGPGRGSQGAGGAARRPPPRKIQRGIQGR